MKGKTNKGGAIPKTPRESLSPGPIKKYMTQDCSQHKQATEKQPPEKQPITRAKQNEVRAKRDKEITEDSMLTLNQETLEAEQDPEGDPSQSRNVIFPTKLEIGDMFAALEKSLKMETTAIQKDLSHLLGRLEDSEKKMEAQSQQINKMKKDLKEMKIDQRNLAYKLEDQENRDRRNNLRVKGMSEGAAKEDLHTSMRKLFNPLMNKKEEEPMELERVHRIGRILGRNKDLPRDVIVRFYKYEDRDRIWRSLKGRTPLKLEGDKIEVYADLSQETLNRRRLLKPLLEVMKNHGITYNWGFPACLIGRKEGRTATLRFPEDLQEFCRKLEIPNPEIPGWQGKIKKKNPQEGYQDQWTLVKK